MYRICIIFPRLVKNSYNLPKITFRSKSRSNFKKKQKIEFLVSNKFRQIQNNSIIHVSLFLYSTRQYLQHSLLSSIKVITTSTRKHLELDTTTSKYLINIITTNWFQSLFLLSLTWFFPHLPNTRPLQLHTLM